MRDPTELVNDIDSFELTVDTKALGEIIKKARGRDLSQRELAKKTNLSNSTVSRIENGVTFEIEVKGLYKISKVLHLNFLEIFGAMYPTIRDEYQEMFEMITILDTLSLNDKKALMDIARGLILYRELALKGTKTLAFYKALHEIIQEE